MTKAEQFLWGVQTGLLLEAQASSENLFNRSRNFTTLAEAVRVSANLDSYPDLQPIEAAHDFVAYMSPPRSGRFARAERPEWFDTEPNSSHQADEDAPVSPRR